MTDPGAPTVVVVGGGCAGTLTAANLLRAPGGPLRVVLVERSGRFGPGVAYATADHRHLLNVAAERMSAYPDQPGHFARWARAAGHAAAPGAFLPRAVYGDYLRHVLDDAARAGARRGRCLERLHGEVVALQPAPAAGTSARGGPGAAADGGAHAVLADGRRIAAAHVVLALGSVPGPPAVPLPEDPRVVADPWAAGALEGPAGDGETLLIGSGLTAVDVALTLAAREPRRRLIAVSRGGCLPFDHLPGRRTPVPAPPPPAAPCTVEALERWLALHVARARRAGHDWRDAIDGVRDHVQAAWRALPVHERRRFLRDRLRPWELRRHRMAPGVAAQVRALRAEGRLLVRAGRVVGVRALARTVEVLVATGDQLRTLRAGRVVLCAGIGGDVTCTRSPLVQALLADGHARPDDLSLGICATDGGTVIGADGRLRPWLHVLGPLRRGELLETTAVGEIRVQAQALARTLAAAIAPPAAAPADVS